jgi:hypothetical protein
MNLREALIVEGHLVPPPPGRLGAPPPSSPRSVTLVLKPTTSHSQLERQLPTALEFARLERDLLAFMFQDRSGTFHLAYGDECFLRVVGVCWFSPAHACSGFMDSWRV